MSGFHITSKKGFHITFANGWTVSVQFGPGNYCANRHFEVMRDNEQCGERGSTDAEIAAWPEGGSLRAFPEFGFDGDTVKGWVTPDEVLAFMTHIASLPAEGAA
jgi:hypothetical protein